MCKHKILIILQVQNSNKYNCRETNWEGKPLTKNSIKSSSKNRHSLENDKDS